MKDVLKLMRFDFLTARSMALGAFAVIAFMCFLLSLFFSPLICAYITFGIMTFILPLQSVADKNDFNKLYGILPVQRKSITRARFLYIFLAHFITQLLEIVLAFISSSLQLYRLLPNQNSATMQMVHDAFNNSSLTFITITGVFILLCLVFSYLEMMGQIHGKENEIKILIITLGVIGILVIGYFILSADNIIPSLKLPNLPTTIIGKAILGVCLNLVTFGICMLFCEITANKLAKREL